jgi:hypothetical protein
MYIYIIKGKTMSSQIISPVSDYKREVQDCERGPAKKRARMEGPEVSFKKESPPFRFRHPRESIENENWKKKVDGDIERFQKEIAAVVTGDPAMIAFSYGIFKDYSNFAGTL